ncbi:MAG: MBL fold metallo-hydrolase [Anaerolineae bacterium]|nr:MBL fold metallo-hydrolase [Anaerolineae bacterium]
MELVQVGEGVHAFLRPDEGANVGLVRTAEGLIVVDTTSCAADMQGLLDAVGVSTDRVCQVINTHSHSDHTWGNQLFRCSILSHRLCRETMAINLQGPWKLDTIRESIALRSQTDPDWAREMQKETIGLQITLPTDTLDRRALKIGGVRLEVIHVGAHSPGSCVVWLPEPRILFAGDLVFEGRYPFIGDADIPALIGAIRRLPDFDAQTIVPGHGRLCSIEQISALGAYLEGTWARTIDHLAAGHSTDEAAADPGYPHYAEKAAERLHEANIRVMFSQLAGDGACPL